MFFKKKNEDDEYKEKIKSSMDEELPFELDIMEPPAEPLVRQSYRRLPQDDIAAPLFVKVEKYKEILVTVQEMKVFVAGVKQLLPIITEADNIKGDALKMVKASIQRMEKNLIEIDSELLRPRGIDIEVTKGDIEVRQIQSSLTELQDNLSNLKKELNEMR